MNDVKKYNVGKKPIRQPIYLTWLIWFLSFIISIMILPAKKKKIIAVKNPAILSKLIKELNAFARIKPISGITPWKTPKARGIDHSFLPLRSHLYTVQLEIVKAQASIESASAVKITSIRVIKTF